MSHPGKSTAGQWVANPAPQVASAPFLSQTSFPSNHGNETKYTTANECGTQTRKETQVKNVKCEVKGNLLTITVDLSAQTTTSKSGKSAIVASTEGNIAVPGTDGLTLGLNAYKRV